MNETEKIFSAINQSKNILLICHRAPDGDTLGSAAALFFYLTGEAKKKSTIFCVNEIPESLFFLNINNAFICSKTINLQLFDLIVTLDCADLKQTGIPEILSEQKNKIQTINIDHHATNTNYANVNLVNPQASATAEIIYSILKQNKSSLTKQITTGLLAGILTDTTYFSNAATTKQAVAAAADLLKEGAKIRQIIQNTWCRHSPESLKLWGKVLSELQYNEKHKIVSAIIPDEAECGKAEIFEGMANFLTSIYDADIIIVLRQENGIVKCSMRTTKDEINVAELARKFGGGGHAKAAGFSIPGQIVKTENSWRID
ncbi:DHH family phosphoesterase [Patescibacteria group bacterium]|nr:DHH family phosphoesterase [Patescibacteria group bacterium]